VGAAAAIPVACVGCAVIAGISGYHDQGLEDAGTAPSDGAVLSSPSCANLTTACGSNGESCCTSPRIEGGTFNRTYTYSGGAVMDQADPATVSSFRLDNYEVTVGRFRSFVSAWQDGSWKNVVQEGSGKHTHVNGGKGLVNSGGAGGYERGWVAAENEGSVAPNKTNLDCWATAVWTESAGANESLAMDCVTWAEAYAFCIWDGGFLPTDAEWAYAAAGGSAQREYPWGTAPPGTANQYAIYGCYDSPSMPGQCSGRCNAPECGNAFIVVPVGSAPAGAGLWGQLDLAGNVSEWVMDWNGDYTEPCSDCADLEATPDAPRVVRGGSFFTDAESLSATSRGNIDPQSRQQDVGFRCARSP
jgi:formylglycine-generating enzyme required for sulfatase activity